MIDRKAVPAHDRRGDATLLTRVEGVFMLRWISMAALLAFFLWSGSAHAANPAVSAGVGHMLALDRAGNITAWGSDADGKLGQGRTLAFATPRKIEGLPNGVVALSAAGDEVFPQMAALDSQGYVWTWGANGIWLGPRGDTSLAKPARVLGIDRVAQVEAGRSSVVALRQDGTVWYWGVIDGLPFAANPTPIAGMTDVTRIAAGDRSVFAQRRDGSLWAMGRNDCGELGDGTTQTRSTWVRVALPASPTLFGSAFAQSFAGDRRGPACLGSPAVRRRLCAGTRSTRVDRGYRRGSQSQPLAREHAKRHLATGTDQCQWQFYRDGYPTTGRSTASGGFFNEHLRSDQRDRPQFWDQLQRPARSRQLSGF
jgi:Regulator of chromosome condensation (RCC1) repeat